VEILFPKISRPVDGIFFWAKIMAKTYTRKQLKERFKNTNWVFGYKELIAAYDKKNNLIMLIEDYMDGLYAEAWRTFHFPRTSPLVKYAKREGTKSIFYIKPGRTELKLIPAFAPIGIRKATVSKNEIKINYSGLGGGGVSASYCRGLAGGVKKIEIIREAGGNKHGEATVTLPRYHHLIIGVDDTDTPEEGATYALVHNIANKIQDGKNIRYISHVNTQLYPKNPRKTKNCMSTSVGFLLKPGLENKVINFFIRELKKGTLSNNTSMIALRGFFIPPKLKQFGKILRTKFFNNLSYVKRLIKELDLEYYVITGEEGLIGSLGAISLHDNPDLAASLPPGFSKLK